MKTIPGLPALLFCLLVPSLAVLADPTAPAPSAAPASLDVPVNQTLALTLTAKGVQIYECRQVALEPAMYEWAFKAPEADLFDAQGRKVGRHYAGPTWELTDGGKVIGKLKAKADAPDGKGIPWLLLEAAQASGGGTMGKVRSIRRVNTVGGKAPAEPAKAGREARVEYTATYEFYVVRP